MAKTVIKNPKTNTNTTTVNKPAGVSDKSWQDAHKDFDVSDSTKEKEKEKNQYASAAQDFYSNTDIVDQDTKNKMNAGLDEYLSPEIAQADEWLKTQLAQIQSGKTSWTDQYNNAINEYLNREDFEYDVDNDQLFQQALASAMNSGRTAMQDTIGQASALTGGYGSTYATTAGNQAYNQFIEDAYNNLPEYYQMALEAYQMEGQEMLNRVNVLGTADDKEYGRMVDAYNMTSDYSNNLWNRGYNEWATTTSNAINYGNFLLNENQAIGQNLRNAYDISSNEYESAYSKEFDLWNTEISNAWQSVGVEQSDYQFGVSQSNADREYALNEKQYRISTGDTNGDGILSPEEKAAASQTYTYDSNGNVVAGSNTNSTTYITNEKGEKVAVNVDGIPKDVSTKASKFKTDAELEKYLDGLEKSGVIDETQSLYLYGIYSSHQNYVPTSEITKDWTEDDWKHAIFKKVEDTINWWGGEDDDLVIVNGETYSVNDIKKMMKDAGMDDATITAIYNSLVDLETGKTIVYKK